MFKCTPVFYANFNAKEKIIVNQGGTSSSKTYSIMQLLYFKAITENRVIITVTGESIPNLKKGAYRDAETILFNSPELEQRIESWNKSDRIIYFKNGSIIEFVSNLTEQSAKNGKRDYLFVNEANGIDWLIYWQLSIRTRKQIFIDYNPTAPFWVHDQLIGNKEVKLIISDHRHNCFLSEEEHSKIEGIKDKELWLVYARGLTGNITGIIFPNWTIIDDTLFPKDSEIFGGIDFGYTNDPTAAVKLTRIGESIYIHELCYTTNLSPLQLREMFISNGFNNDTPIYCEHDPEMVSQLRRLGLMALPARKGQGSIKAGIQHIKTSFKMYYTNSSNNLKEELRRYVWIKDPKDGKPTNTPIDNYCHLIDAIRYGVYTHYFRA